MDIFKTILDNTLAGYWDWDIKNNAEFFSKGFHTMLGYNEYEFPNSPDTWKKYIFKEDHELLKKHFDEHVASKGRKPFHVEVRYRHKNGSTVWVICVGRVTDWDKDGNPLRSVGCQIDITRFKEEELKLRQENEQTYEALTVSERQNRSIIESLSEGIVLHDLSGTIITSNESAHNILGLTHDQLIGKTSFHPDWRTIKEDGEPFPPELHPATITLRTGEPQRNVIMGVYKPHGQLSWVLINSMPMFHPESEMIHGVVVSFTDITLLKNQETELRRTAERSEDQHRRLVNFAEIISHNMRSHTSNMEMLVSAFLHSSNEGEKKQIIDYLQETSQRLTETINNLNEVVSIQASEVKEPLNLRLYIDKTIAALDEDIREVEAQVKIEVPEDTYILYNPVYLQSSLHNFVTNSIRYRSPERPLKLSLSVEKSTEFIRLNISDNGLGLNLERYGKKIMGMYKTFHGHPEARGVGLYITKTQLNAMGGFIEVESRENEGTTFRVHFPLY